MGVYFEKNFRNLLFGRCYLKLGSLGEIAVALGYQNSSSGHGSIRDMWSGQKSIPADRLDALLKLAKVPARVAEQHIVPKEENVLYDWNSGFSEFLGRRET